MSTTTLLRRPTGPRTLLDRVLRMLTTASAKLGEIYERKDSVEPRNESWRYFSA